MFSPGLRRAERLGVIPIAFGARALALSASALGADRTTRGADAQAEANRRTVLAFYEAGLRA